MSDIRTGTFLKKLQDYFDTKRSIIVTDKNIDSIYGEYFSGFKKLVLPPGEKSKNLKNIELIYKGFLDNKIDRGDLVVGVGGGVVCDMAGFAASTFLRGVNFGFIPTTLLSMVDASIGGKNGVDLYGYKNIVGTFNLPDFVYIDLAFLETLDNIEYLNGVSEILKYGFIIDRKFLELTIKNRKDVLEKNSLILGEIINRSIEIKSEIVKEDRTENGKRRVLNFGHTFGHAFEKVLLIPHGMAVAAGMVMAAEFSESEKFINRKEVKEVEKIISGFGLPVKIDFSPAPVISAIEKDKKRDKEMVRFVFLESIGRSVVKKVGLKKIEEFTNAMCKSG